MLVPLLSGSGMRIKIIEGMALAKAIVSTTIGAEGILAKDGEEMLIAKNKEEFLEKTLQLIQDREFYMKISKNARSFIENEFDNSRIVSHLIKQYESLIK